MIDEYDVTFAVKEWLSKHGWVVVAFNPPGSQGTFTIPNPAKDPRYRGQTGSVSPDIIAIKNANYVLIIESKPAYNQKDTEKLLNLYKNKERMNLLIDLLEKVCQANNVPFKKPAKIILAKAHGGQNTLRMDMLTFLVSTDNKWNPTRIDPTIDPFKFMKVIFRKSNRAIGEIVTN
ncbi:MAG: hypothetical protein U9O96_02665 [Candidatus Thermoplasmatota archaeon]|nr:hypothetical protein [Candidatus Thermoplasmatota archaeon]